MELIKPVRIGVFTDGSEITIDPNQFNNLTQTQQETVTVTYTVINGGGPVINTATFIVTGANDDASITAAVGGDYDVIEDGGEANGTVNDPSVVLNIADADSGEAGFKTPASLQGNYGTFTFNAVTGVWGYTLTVTLRTA